jgi:hypothetical protein
MQMGVHHAGESLTLASDEAGENKKNETGEKRPHGSTSLMSNACTRWFHFIILDPTVS